MRLTWLAALALVCADPAQPARLCLSGPEDPARRSNPACPPLVDEVVIYGRRYTESRLPPNAVEEKLRAVRDEKRAWIKYRDCWEYVLCKEAYPGLGSMQRRYFGQLKQ